MIKLSNIIIDEETIETVEPKKFNGTPVLLINTKSGITKVAIYTTEEARDIALNNLILFLKIECC